MMFFKWYFFVYIKFIQFLIYIYIKVGNKLLRPTNYEECYKFKYLMTLEDQIPNEYFVKWLKGVA